jgi:putative peptide zinc metalloprotease protein
MAMEAPPALPPLSRTRHALVRALRAGATPEQAASRTGWSPERVRREAIAAVEALAPPTEAGLAAGERRRIAARLLTGRDGRAESLAPAAAVWAARAAAALERVAPAPAPRAGVPERPRLGADVEIEPPAPAAGFRVVHAGCSGTYLRVELPQARLLESLDGSRTAEELERAGGVPAPMVRPLLARFAALGLLEGTERADAERRGRRVRGRATGAVQLKVGDPSALLERARPLIRRVASPAGLLAGGLAALAGPIALAARTDAGLLTGDRLQDPVLVGTLVVALLLTALAHELGHAIAVVAFGGRVRRMGLMLFYLLPAMFCDTSDAWRFPYRRQRVTVAFAGMAAQLAVVGLVCQVLWLPLGEAARAWLLLYAIANAGIIVTSLVPLVKLDGYWALAAAVDRPNLRPDGIRRAGAWARRLAFGDPVGRRDRHEAALVAFGVAAALFAPALLAYALLRWHDLLLEAGAAGAALWLIALGLVLARPLAAAWTALRARPAPRALAFCVALPLVLVGVALQLPVASSAHGSFDRSGEPPGRALVDIQSGDVRPGDRVDLGTRSLISRTVATGTVVGTSAGARVIVALDPGGRLARRGDATVHLGRRPAGAWLWSTYVVGTARALGL